jgi:hypothetical protein
MLVDKIRDASGLSMLAGLPDDYIDRLALNIPPHLNRVIANVVAALLRNVNVPDDEISRVTDRIDERGVQKMFDWIEGYDVQETRRVAKREGKIEDARGMKKENIPIAIIAKITGLPKSEIKKLIFRETATSLSSFFYETG